MMFLDPKTYKRLLYLFLAFPTGLIYFIFLIVGFSLGVGLSVILIGIPIFLFTLSMTIVGVEIERSLANFLLDTEIPSRLPTQFDARSIVKRLISPRTLTDTLYLFLKFPLGLITFIFSVVPTLAVFALILTPFYYNEANTTVFDIPIQTFPEAMIACIIGLFLATVAHPWPGMVAGFWKQFTRAMIGSYGGNREKHKNAAKRKNDDYFYEDDVYVAIPEHATDTERQSIQSIADMINEDDIITTGEIV